MSSSFVSVFLLFFPPLTVCSCFLNSTSFLLPTLLVLSFLPDSYSCPSCSTFLPSSFDTAITPVLPAITLLPLFFVFLFNMTFFLLLCCFCFPPPSSPSLHTAICSSVNGRMLCGCDVVWLWSVCTATVVHSAYQPAASPCLDPAGCLPAWLAGWSSD